MHFDDGSNPWKHSESHIIVFHFDSTQTSMSTLSVILILALLGVVVLIVVVLLYQFLKHRFLPT